MSCIVRIRSPGPHTVKFVTKASSISFWPFHGWSSSKGVLVSLSSLKDNGVRSTLLRLYVSSLEHIRGGLLQGLPAHTPVAIVQHASLPQQREALTTLGDVVGTIAREGLQSPSIIVVGDVVQGARTWGAQAQTAQKAA
jgi:siroheme synthase